MIDIHSHIIPQIDDGSRSIDESVQMAREAKEAGFTAIFVTPHYMLDSLFLADFEIRNQKKEELEQELKKNNIDLEIYMGTEGYICEELIELIESEKVSVLNNSKYVLFELPMNISVIYLNNIIIQLKSKNIIPIIAHPERYMYVQKDITYVKELRNKGVLFQANYPSILGKYGNDAKKTMKKLLKEDLIDFLGSDTHHKESVYTQIPKAKKKIIKIIGEEKFEELSEINPRNIIENK